ncbi:flagellar biosynthetic protein FliO [Pygmaiobacter massiliensis]|uniref:FliO/MopB family protein n=1 Tax=Pygmaiobacter massiliensis TaxID=1917873 RepID=UPI002A836E1E|nr:flagellar biosynthetic protein FliO [Pygmaiobacter massiliensis]
MLLGTVAAVVAVLFLSYWFTKYVVGGGALQKALPSGAGKRMQVLDQFVLGKDQKLLVVRVAQRYFLLGVSAAQMTNLAELTAEEAAAWQPDPAQEGEPTPPSFYESLRTVLNQRKK